MSSNGPAPDGHRARRGRRPRLGLALGSGAARGWAHIGVLQALRDAGIKPDIVAGTSIGALVGGAFVSGHLQALADWVVTLTWRDTLRMMDFRVAGGGLIEGRRLMDFFREKVGDTAIEDLPLPFAAVATDLETGGEVWLREGSLLDALRASIALPGLFTPVVREKHWLVDGGLVNPVPVSGCRALGAEVVVAVQVHDHAGHNLPRRSRHRDTAEEEDTDDVGARVRSRLQEGAAALLPRMIAFGDGQPGLFDVVVGSINVMQRFIMRSRLAGDPPDFVLAPAVSDIGLLEFDRAREALRAGHTATTHLIPALQQVLE